MTAVANSDASRFRPKALFLGWLLGGYDAGECPNFFFSKYRPLAFQVLIFLSAANCLMALGSSTVVRPGLNLVKTIHNLWGKYAVTRNDKVSSL